MRLLNKFRSVLHVPENLDKPICILHLSFPDFLLQTKSPFHVDKAKTHEKLASCCFCTMDDSLRQNICHLPSYGTEREMIGDQVPPADLQYSCQYWAQHLKNSSSISLIERAYNFLKTHFLHWMEAMNLLGLGSDVVGIIDMLQLIVQVNFL